jgi:thiamine-monophosphate kinase
MSVSGEHVRLEFIKEVFGQNSPSNNDNPVLLSAKAGDDAAIIQLSGKEALVVSSDFVRGPHFYLAELGYLNWFDLGYYLVVANLSDLAAMGALPIALTTIIRYSKEMTDEEFVELLRGVKSAADEYGTSIVGGDIGGYVDAVLAATALGVINPSKALLRNGVNGGDLLCVTGVIGLPITAVLYFKDWKERGLLLIEKEEEELLRSWRRPTPRIQEGRVLSEIGASACQDISDGLRATIDQISRASGKYFMIDADALPIHNTTKKLAEFAKADPIQIAMSASVDFELVFTATEEKVERLRAEFDRLGTPLSVIGRVSGGRSNCLIDAERRVTKLPGVPWDQQTSDYLNEAINGGRHV